MKYAWLIIAVFSSRFLVSAIAYPQVDGDLSWQRWLGAQILRTGAIPRSFGAETFTAPGVPWLPQEWLFSILAALGSSGWGWIVFSGSVALCAVGALVLSAIQAERRGASAKAVALCMVFAGIGLFMSYGVRAQVVAWPLLVAFLMLLESEGGVAWLAVLVAAVWSNFHASAALAPVLAMLAAAGAWLDAGRPTRRVRRLFGIALASLAAICCNPFGWKLPVYALGLMHASFKANISEWQPMGVGQASFLYGALPLLLIVAVFGVVRRSGRRFVGWERVLTFAALTWLLMGAARNIAIFALVAAPMAATALTDSIRWFAPDGDPGDPRHRWIPRIAMPAVAMTMSVVLAIVLLIAGRSNKDDDLALPALAALAHQPGNHRVICTDFAWCGLLVGKPGTQVFIDGRADPYPEKVWDAYIIINRLRPGWRRVLASSRVDTVVAGRDAPLDQALEAAGGWRAAFTDTNYRLWLLSPRRAAADIHRDGGA
jgi:hypothetical protein